MKYVCCSLYDVASGAFGRPMFGAALGAITRAIADEVNRVASDNAMANHPVDFQLYHLGSFDDSSGLFELLDIPVRIANCVDLVMKPN